MKKPDLLNRRPEEMTVADVCSAHIAMGMDDIDARTVQCRTYTLNKFCQDLGSKLVKDCRAIDLQSWMLAHPEYKTESTRRGILAGIKRAFNWACDMEIVERNPFSRVRSRGQLTRRQPMSDRDFQTFMRFSPPHYRRLLVFLKFTGARPGEASAMRWRNVRFEQGSVILHDHKSAKKTGRPRIIPLVPTTAKLLAWMRTHRQVTPVGLLERFLAKGPMKASHVARYLHRYGVSDRAAHKARQALGVIKERVGGDGCDGYYAYALPPDYKSGDDPGDNAFVFVTCLGNPLNRSNMALWVQRTKKRAGISSKVSLYCLRHAFGLRGIKNGVNLKLLSLCMGHTRTQMTEHYISDAGLTDDMKGAALQIAYGPGAHAAGAAPHQPVPINVPEIPPVEELSYSTEFIPSRAAAASGLEKGRPQVPIVPVDPGPATENKLEALMSLMLTKLADTPKPARRPKRASMAPNVLRPAKENAYRAYLWALEQEPVLANGIDREVFAWLQARADCPHKLPPLFTTFQSYLTDARLHYDTRKRQLRPRVAEPGTGE